MDWHELDIGTHFTSGTAYSAQDEPKEDNKSFHIVISDGEVLSIDSTQEAWRPLSQDEYRWLGTQEVSSHYLGSIGDISIFANEIDPEAEEPEGYTFSNLWSFLGRVQDATFNLIGRSKQIVEWYQNHQYCGQCGAKTGSAESDRSRKCYSCGQLFYPRLSPSIIVLISKGEEILLAKNAATKGNFYSTLAGFVEPGESIEAAVHREVMEEVGIKVKNLKYFNSQSWPFPNSLMLGFHAEYDSGEINIQEEEIADAQWFHYTEMPNKPAMVSISGWLIDSHIKKLLAEKS